jgi:hypothetical protein
MINRDDLIEAFTDAYHNIGIGELDYKWVGEYDAGDELDSPEYPELEVYDATWENISNISFRFIREYFADDEVPDILNALKNNMPLEINIHSDHSIDDGDYLATTIAVTGKLTIIGVEVKDNLVHVNGKAEYVESETN